MRLLQGIRMRAINKCQGLLKKGVRYISASLCDIWYWHTTTSDTRLRLPPAFRTPLLRKEQLCYKRPIVSLNWNGSCYVWPELSNDSGILRVKLTPIQNLAELVFCFYLQLFCIITAFSKREKNILKVSKMTLMQLSSSDGIMYIKIKYLTSSVIH